MARAGLYRGGYALWASHGGKDSDKRGMERRYFRRGIPCKSIVASGAPQACGSWEGTYWLREGREEAGQKGREDQTAKVLLES